MRREMRDVHSFEQQLSLLRPIKAIDAVHHTSLARSIWTYNRKDLTLVDVEAHIGQSGNSIKGEKDTLGLKYDIRHSASPLRNAPRSLGLRAFVIDFHREFELWRPPNSPQSEKIRRPKIAKTYHLGQALPSGKVNNGVIVYRGPFFRFAFWIAVTPQRFS